MDSGEEIRSYDVSSSYTVARFYNDEKGVILAGFTGFVAMDLETEEIAYQEEYLVGMYGTCMDILANGTRIVHASNDKISVFEINGKDVVSMPELYSYSLYHFLTKFLSIYIEISDLK